MGAPLFTSSLKENCLMKEWTMGGPLFTFTMKGKARGSTLHFLNEGNGTGVPLFTFSMKEWRTGAPLFTFSMNETAKGSALLLITFSMK